jgi:coenzyme F420-reducing hydrogenase alpha subunit
MVQIIPPITAIETIAEGSSIRELQRLRQHHGPGRWKKKKGVALVEAPDGTMQRAEIHWYEAHGIGKVKMKVKRWL